MKLKKNNPTKKAETSSKKSLGESHKSAKAERQVESNETTSVSATIQKKEFHFTKSEIDTLKSSISEIDDIDTIRDENLDDLKELKKSSTENFVILGRLYFKCYTILKEIKEYLKNSKNIYAYVDSLTMSDDFASNVEYYNSGKFGSYFKSARIQIYVLENKKDINTLVDLFFKIFGEE